MVVFFLVASGLCLIGALFFTVWDSRGAKELREAAKKASERVRDAPAAGAIQAQAGVDFGGLANLAEALGSLNRSGRLFIISLGFAAIAGAVVIAEVAVSRPTAAAAHPSPTPSHGATDWR